MCIKSQHDQAWFQRGVTPNTNDGTGLDEQHWAEELRWREQQHHLISQVCEPETGMLLLAKEGMWNLGALRHQWIGVLCPCTQHWGTKPSWISISINTQLFSPCSIWGFVVRRSGAGPAQHFHFWLTNTNMWQTEHILFQFTREFYQNCLGLKWRSLSEKNLPTVHLTLHWTLMEDYDLPPEFVPSKSFIVCVSVGFNSLAPHNIINRPLLGDQPAMALRVRQCQIIDGITEDSLLSPLSLLGNSGKSHHGCLQVACCWGHVSEVVQRQKKIIYVR